MNNWISVKDRLPEDQMRVIVRDKNKPTVIGWIMFGEWYTDFGRNMYKNYEVTHWMPLPEPPKGE